MVDLEVPLNTCGCEYGSGEFCGMDGQCHIYSCQSWYEFAPRNWTGYDAESPLVCQDLISPTQLGRNDVFGESVAFRCKSSSEPIQMGFTNKCTATGTNSEFICYGLSANTNFQPFLDEAAESQLNCTDDEYDETGYPKFTYSVITFRCCGSSIPERVGDGAFHIGSFQQGFNGTIEFNETLALTGTMQARYEVWADQATQSPTVRPTTFTTQAGNSVSSSFSICENNVIMAIVGSLLGVQFLLRFMF